MAKFVRHYQGLTPSDYWALEYHEDMALEALMHAEEREHRKQAAKHKK